ncbi:MAG: hypothetical protein CMI15_15120 [Opitutaceae bacterium]|nr:hypothetical protein [Opitutaceae bacterium]
MIVEAQFRTHLPCCFDERQKRGSSGCHPFALGKVAIGGSQSFPDLRLHPIFPKQTKDFRMFVPKGEEFDTFLLASDNLPLELLDMLASPVVGETGNPEFAQHLGPLFGRALFDTEWDNAPGDEI